MEKRKREKEFSFFAGFKLMPILRRTQVLRTRLKSLVEL
jgi:hypothetical protein